MNTEIINSTVDGIYSNTSPVIYASPLEAKWQAVIRNAIAACDHEVDRWDIKFTLNGFKVIEDSSFKTIELTGKEFDINWLKRQFLEIFDASFNKEFTNYKFKLIEEK